LLHGIRLLNDSLPANSPNKPIKVIINAKDLVFPENLAAITSSGKYDEDELEDCKTLVGITIPNIRKTVRFPKKKVL